MDISGRPRTTTPSPTQTAKFVEGPTMRHVLVMTSTASIGLLALFLVDFADLYFLSLLGEVEVAAAIGYAGAILFFTTSIGIGLSIAAASVVSRKIGAGDAEAARRLATNCHIYAGTAAVVLSALIWPLLPGILDVLGAGGRTHELAVGYLRIIVPSMPLLALGMCSSAVLRSIGDAKRSMYITLTGGFVNALLDPILIFGAGLGVEGAAMASVGARVAVFAVGIYGVHHVHHLFQRLSQAEIRTDIKRFSVIALPAILTNIATPFGNSYVTASIAPFGDSAVAGWAVIGRIIPVAFGALFALSGAIGPILGQNLGARRLDRVRRALTEALILMGVYVLFIWLLLALSRTYLSALFSVSGDAAMLIHLFCLWLTPFFGFLGALFVANAAFNNLGRAHYSTIFNWGRATLGTIPFVYLGGQWYGPAGVIAGNMAGGLIFGTAAIVACYRLINKLATNPKEAGARDLRLQRRWPLWPFTTPRG